MKNPRRSCIFFRSPRTEDYIHDARRSSLIDRQTNVIVLCGGNDASEKAGDLTIEMWARKIDPTGEIVVICNGGAHRLVVTVVAQFAALAARLDTEVDSQNGDDHIPTREWQWRVLEMKEGGSRWLAGDLVT